jgi:hypothetical protein
MQYQLEFDYVFSGSTSNPTLRKTLQRKVVEEYMADFGYTEESLAKVIKERTAAKTVHPLYGTD